MSLKVDIIDKYNNRITDKIKKNIYKEKNGYVPNICEVIVADMAGHAIQNISIFNEDQINVVSDLINKVMHG